MSRVIPSLLLVAALLTGCAEASAPDTGTLLLGLRTDVGGWFRLKILETAPDASLNGEVVFDTRCTDARSRTYELSNIPAGDNRWVVIESFADAACSGEGRAEVGYRGQVDIPAGTASPYYHVPIYEVGAVTPLPEDINISAAVAAPIDFCDSDAQCAHLGNEYGCFDGQKPTYWCVPGCTTNADCADFHPRARCQSGTGWCVLSSPFPLNLSEPRAMGAAASLSDGSVAFVGGFGLVSGGKVRTGATAVERFDAALGLFVKPAIEGLGTWNSAFGGFADLGDDRVVVVGGLRSIAMSWDGADAAFRLRFEGTAEEDCSGAACVPNMLDDIAVIDLGAGRAKLSSYPLAAVRPTVVRLDADTFLVAGGTVPNVTGDSVVVSDRAHVCSVDASLGVSCAEAGALTVARTGAAGACVDPTCSTVLIAGGTSSGASFEVARVSGGTATFEAVTVPASLGGLAQPALCGQRLVAGMSTSGGGAALAPLELALEDTTLSANPLASDTVTELPTWAAVAPLTNGNCWVSGGLTPDGSALSRAFYVVGASVLPGTQTLTFRRFGAAAAEVTRGPLDGAVLIGGGLRLAGTEDAGTVEFVRGVEVLIP